MKLIVLFVSLLLVGIAHGQKKSFVINGTTPEVKEGEMLVLISKSGKLDTLGCGVIVDSKFTINGEIEEPHLALLQLAGFQGGFVFLLDSDAPYEVELWKDKKSTIKGGMLQTTLNQYQDRVAKGNKELEAMNAKVEEASKEKRFKTVGELKKKMEQKRGKILKELDAIVEANKDNLFGAYIQTAGMERMNLEALKQCYAKLSDKAKETDPGRFVLERIKLLENVEQGSVAPNFTLQTPEGEDLSMYDIKGKIKIIDFWASWCGPCRLENPNMVKLYNDFKDKGLVVISVSLDDKKDKWLDAIKKDGMTWIHLSDLRGWKSGIVKTYNIDGVPTILVLDENNRILAKNLRGEKLRAFVSERLK